jgi:hypothetical protein
MLYASTLIVIAIVKLLVSQDLASDFQKFMEEYRDIKK